MPFAAMQLELEIIIQVSQKKKTKQISYINTYMRKLKYGTKEPNCKTDSYTWRSDLWLPSGRVGGKGIDWDFVVGRCKLLHL